MSSIHSLSSLLRENLPWRKSRVETFVWILLGIIDQGTVRLWRLASCSPGDAKTSSTIRRFERFFASQKMCWRWRARLYWRLAGRPKRCDLLLDRTQWCVGKKNVNVLVLAVSAKRFTFPLLWTFLPHRGNSKADDCARLLDQFIELFGSECIGEVLADREFGNGPMVDILLKRNINFTIRVKADSKICTEQGKTLSLGSLCRKTDRGQRRNQSFRLITQMQQGKFQVACSFKHRNSARGQPSASVKPDQMILLTTRRPDLAIKRYRKRWKIETLFADLKTRGFNLEQSRITAASKLDLLWSIVALAYVWVCSTVGNKQIKIRQKKHGYKAKSWFRLAQEWTRKRIRYRPDEMIQILKLNLRKMERVG